MMMGDVQSKGLQPKKTPITDDYELSSKVLGLGINGKVVVCHHKASHQKCALKVTWFLLLLYLKAFSRKPTLKTAG